MIDAPETAPSAGVSESDSMPGIIPELGSLPAGAVITSEGLAQLFKRHPFSLKRAIERGEFPRPARIFGKDCWTIGSITRHIEKRLEQAAKDADRLARKVEQLKP